MTNGTSPLKGSKDSICKDGYGMSGKQITPGIFVSGTDTGIGKTLVAGLLAAAYRKKGINVGIMKPVESGGGPSSDSSFLKAVAMSKDPISSVNPYHFKEPVAPLLASNIENRPIDIGTIIEGYGALSSRHDLMIVEGAGGISVQIDQRNDMADLARALGLPVLVVARSSLGTINHTVLTTEHVRNRGAKVLGVVFNDLEGKKESPVQMDNARMICEQGKVDVLGSVPWLKGISIPERRLGQGVRAISRALDLDSVLDSIRAMTEDPSMMTKTLVQLDKDSLWHPFTQMKDWLQDDIMVVERGEGPYLIDTNGARYLDGVASLWVNVHGHRKQEIDLAIMRQLNKLAHSTMLGLANVPATQLASRLLKIVPAGLTKVFYSDNGSTAVEIALKMAFQYWQHKGRPGKRTFVSLENGYHGDTIGAVSVGGHELFHHIFAPLLFKTYQSPSPYCYRCGLGLSRPECAMACVERMGDILKKRSEEVCAVILEPLVQGAGGMINAPKGYLRRVRELCDEHDVLLIADEVAVGFGRTGKMFACEHENVNPDIMAVAKGLSGGYLPLAATMTKESIYEAFLGDRTQKRTFFHGHSFTGNPLACASALANLDIFERERTLKRLGPKISQLKKLLDGLAPLEHVGQIRQRGFMVGIELVKDRSTKEPYDWSEQVGAKVCRVAKRSGVILRPLGNVIVIMPPYCVDNEQIATIVRSVRTGIQRICG